ncbi:hypothetical protein SAMN05444673_4044 [Bacillus sp. OV166]|uniref:hypothetical protein n=1 Tax=Bacillus sp. OV166 TaxID=1882763 RepID=UPI000A2AE575|nr:hypothetical protein [Bacillus sp. OV166]SMQ80929.1 hypothetical protein SAMN05444673_4044 [Bacillus sp. OV166]
MKQISLFLLILGILLTVFGLIPLIFGYPYSNSSNSGPENFWELIVIISYEIKGWVLLSGILISLLSLLLHKRITILK